MFAKNRVIIFCSFRYLGKCIAGYSAKRTVASFFLAHPVCDHNPLTSQTDRGTDRRTCDHKTALCTKVHCTVKSPARPQDKTG